jgi:hypothetical protein
MDDYRKGGKGEWGSKARKRESRQHKPTERRQAMAEAFEAEIFEENPKTGCPRGCLHDPWIGSLECDLCGGFNVNHEDKDER